MDRGIYILIIKCKSKTYINHPKFDKTGFLPGYYFYIGSAQKNLSKRIQRHYKKQKPLRWHIDYISTHPEFEITSHFTFEYPREFECKLTNFLLSIDFISFPAKKFGSSDCNICPSHLLFCPEENLELAINKIKNEFKFINN